MICYSKQYLRDRREKNNYPELDIKIIKQASIIIESLNHLKKIAIYYPYKSEIDITSLIKIYNNKSFALPKIQSQDLHFNIYKESDLLSKNNFGIYESGNKNFIQPDILFIPAINFDFNGYRVGYGKGYYDRYLAKNNNFSRIISIGVCYHKNLITNIDINIYDYPVNYIITEHKILCF